MRKPIKLTLAVIAAILFFFEASAQQTAKVTSAGTHYLQYLPQGYGSNTNNYPIVISLHGIGEKGNTAADVQRVANVSLAKYVKYGQQYPFILISPQLKTTYGTWPPSYVMEVINHVKKTLRVDSRRIYLTGLSLGGFGVWKTVGAYPSVFAAVAPICSGGNDLTNACKIAAENVPAWTFHGDNDTRVSYQVSLKMINAINACTPKPSPLAKITIYPGLGHGIWDKVYKETNVLNWMLSFTNGSSSTSTQSTDAPTGNITPVVSAGSDKSLTLPTNSVDMQGSASDSDGSIASYQWSKVSGSTASLSGATTSKLKAYNLVAGTYYFRLTVKDNKGASKSDDVKVVVSSGSTTNKLPVVSAGSDRSAIASSQTIVGSASDPDGYIASYQWTKVSGGSVSMYNTTTAKLFVKNFAAGTYVFRLTVKDNKGALKYDEMKFTVGSAYASASISGSTTTSLTTTANISPWVSAGLDKVISYPTRAITLVGKATDADGSVASYLWKKISGGAASLKNATTPKLWVYNLVAGTYVFRLTVKDNDGAVRTDDVRLVVKS